MAWAAPNLRPVFEPSISRSILAQVSPDRAYDAWTEPDHLRRWFCDKVTGWPGSGSSLTMTWERFGFSMEYSLPEVVQGRKVVLKARVPGMGTQTLTITVRPYGQGARVEVTETGPGAEGQRGTGDAESGWEMALAMMKLYVEEHWGKDRAVFFALLAAPYENGQLLKLYTEEAELARWLTREGSIGQVGDPVRLILQEGAALTGRVMARTSHEVSVSWSEIDGYLELKSFEVDEDRRAVCLRGGSYGGRLGPEATLDLEKQMEAALIRLFAALTGQALS